MFDEYSQLTKTWVRLVKSGAYGRKDVPNLSNLREVVWSVLDRAEKERKSDDYGIYKNSALVKTWVSLVLSGAYTKDEVPKLFNLREVVGEVVDSLT